MHLFAQAEAAEVSILWTQVTPDPWFTTVSIVAPDG